MAPPPRPFLQRIRRVLEAADLVTTLTQLFNVAAKPGAPAPPAEVISALNPALSPNEVADLRWIYGVVRGAEVLEGLGMLVGLMGGTTRLLRRAPVDVVPFIHHHVVDLLTYKAALDHSVGIGEGEALRVRLLSEIAKAIDSRDAEPFARDIDEHVARVVSLDLGRAAKKARQRDRERAAAEVRAANPEPDRPGCYRSVVFRPHPYVLRIDNMLDALGVSYEGRDPAIDAARNAFEFAKEALGGPAGGTPDTCIGVESRP